MAESTKLRLVRCPKCENLLSEPEDSPFFQCGGCFTVLRSKIKELDSVSDKSVEEDRTKPVSVSSSSPEKPIVDSSEDTSSDSSDLVPSNVAIETDPCSKPGNTNSIGDKEDPKSKSGRIESGLDRFKRRLSSSTSKYPEATSSIHEFQKHLKDQSNEAIEQDRAGLLRQLDKLKEQLLQSCNVATTQKQPQQQVPNASSSKPGPPLRFYSSGNHNIHPPPGPYYHQAPLEPLQHHHSMMYRDPHMFQMHGRGGSQLPPHPYFSGQQDSNILDVYPHFHHSSCSCYHCYAPYNAGFYPPESNVMGFAPPQPQPQPQQPRSYNARPLGRWASDSRIRPSSKVVLSNGYRHIRPLAGGAPFITCQNCFELLQLPKKQQGEEGVKKLRCGACSCLMDLSILDNKYIVSREQEEEGRRACRAVIATDDYTSSDDYDLLGYVFHSLDDDEPRVISNTHSANLSEEEDSESSPLRDYCLINQDRNGVGSRSSRSEQEKVITLSKRQNSMKEVSLASEMEVSFSDYHQQQRSKKNGFASIVKKSFKDLTKSIQNDDGSRSNVMVNGHYLTDRSMKKAEKQAGVIQPGNYWYDYRAGFWGVMGGPCLGILPPFIEELNYPMPENCAGGTTGVFVNGRELHRKDLDLLAARGLPSERDRSYIVDITGKVIDEDTGEELDCLGKLAPTIEKLKRGFGMRLPKRVAM